MLFAGVYFGFAAVLAGCDPANIPNEIVTSSSEYWTCEKCDSIKETGTEGEKVLYKSPGFNDCKHQWKSGMNTTVKPLVPDDAIVLVKQDNS